MSLFKILVSFAFLLSWQTPALCHPDDPIETTKIFEELLDQLVHCKASEQFVTPVHELTLRRDVGTFTLSDGTLYICNPIMNRTCAAVFTGKGNFSFTPPTEIEQDQLDRFFETRTLVQKFNFLFLLFADSTLEELRSKAAFLPGDIPNETHENIEYCLRYFTDPGKQYIDPDIAKFLLERDRNDLFIAYFSEEKHRPMCFEINPYQTEQVSFLRQDISDHDERSFEIVNKFNTIEDYNSRIDLSLKNTALLKTDTITIECTINNNLSMMFAADIRFHFLKDGQSWIHFLLSPKLEVDSVNYKSTPVKEFAKGRDNSWLWIRCPEKLNAGDTGQLKIYYHGNVLRKDLDVVRLETSTFWYPRYDVTQKSIFDLTFHTPKKYTFVTVGDRISTNQTGNIENSHWITPRPIRNASFNIGFFDQKTLDFPGIPTVTVFMSSPRKGMLDEVGADVANSVNFYQSVFGKSLLTHLLVTEIPYGSGEAFPGLVHLAAQTFENTSSRGTDEIFRAHETAHQWWGIGVGFRTYHDQWLSEGLSDYSALWYMQTMLKDNEKFFDRLDDWKRAIIENRKYLLKNGQEAGPIWLGYRTNSIDTRGDFGLVVYKKGAWVIHMLRNMFLDFQTMNDDAFTAMLREYYATYLDSTASTKNFQRIVEKHAGESMDWFFNEWVYGTKIPKFEFAYKSTHDPDGSYKIRCRVKTLNVSNEFRMPVPILIDFGDDNYYRFRATISGPASEFDLPPFPIKPKDIRFNDLHSVLCEVENVDW